MVLALPRLMGTAWASLQRQSRLLAAAYDSGDVMGVLARALAVVAVVIPVLGIVYVSLRLVRRIVGGTWRRTSGHPVRRTLALARGLFGQVVVDLDHSFREEQIQVLKQADIILLILRLEFASLRNARRALDYLEYLGVGKDRVRLVANRYGQPKEVPAAKAEEALGMKILPQFGQEALAM